MKIFSKNFLMIAGMAALTTISSCKKSEDLNALDTETLNDNVRLDESVSDTFTELTAISSHNIILFDEPETANSSAVNSSGSYAADVFASCKSVTISPLGNSFPKTVTIDFGNGCEEDGKFRKGKIIAVYSGPMKQAGSNVSVTFEKFSVNGNVISGTKTIKNNGLNASGNITYTITVNHTRTAPNGAVFSLKSEKTIEWKEGMNTPNPNDDSFSFTGSDTGVDAKGRTFSKIIIEPIVRKAACRFFVSGKIEISVGDRPKMLLDYGNGECDAKATVTVNNVTKEIILKK